MPKSLGWLKIIERIISPGKNVPYIDGVSEFKKYVYSKREHHPGFEKTLFLVLFWTPGLSSECPYTRSWFVKMLFSSSQKGMKLRKKLSQIYHQSHHGLSETEE